MPIIHNVAQGSTEWLKLRLGIPTASEFHRIVTPGGKLSAQSRAYAFWLVAEELLQESLYSIQSLEWVARGKELEPEAVRMYEFEQNVRTDPVGFITSDDGRLGCSPDRLVVWNDAGAAAVEIKCPAPHTHIGYWIDGFGADYIPQVQGQILIAELDYVDRYSYHPQLPPALVRTERDEKYIAILEPALREFLFMRDEMLAKVRASGYFEEHRKLSTAVDRLAEHLGA